MIILVILGSVVPALADYQQWFFSANGTCPGHAYFCGIPGSQVAACAYDAVTDKHYCCGGHTQGYCRVSSPVCLGADGGPSSIQQLCTAEEHEWCCLKDSEQCTPRTKQINICFGTQQDTIANVSEEFLIETFSSLSSAVPADSTYTFDPTSLVAAAQARSSSTTTSLSIQSSSSSLSSSTTATESSKSSSTLPGGTIAGIVVGCVVGTTAVLFSGYLVFRSYRRSKNPGSSTSDAPEPPWEGNKERCEKNHEAPEQPQPAVIAEAEAGTGCELHELSNKPQPTELSAQ